MAPMFIIMSFAFGLAIFNLVLFSVYKGTGRELGDAIVTRLRKLLGVFIGAILYFVVVFHLTNLYATEHHGVEAFILRDGGIFTQLFWIGQVVIGGLIPLALLYAPQLQGKRCSMIVASVLVILGGLAQMYVIIIGGQAYPLALFPGMEVSSSFFDGVVNTYSPTLPELMLGLGGVAVSLIVVTLAIKALHLLPVSMADSVADPHHKD
jgi:molybdopterin-containing oxidoreductase family membrane subunit